jgi:hypothetical protein
MFTRQKLLNLVTLVRHYKSELIIHEDRNAMYSSSTIIEHATYITLGRIVTLKSFQM